MLCWELPGVTLELFIILSIIHHYSSSLCFFFVALIANTTNSHFATLYLRPYVHVHTTHRYNNMETRFLIALIEGLSRTQLLLSAYITTIIDSHTTFRTTHPGPTNGQFPKGPSNVTDCKRRFIQNSG